MCDTGMLTILGRRDSVEPRRTGMITHQDIPIFVRKLSSGNLAKPEPRSAHIAREPTATKEKLRVERAQSRG